MQIIQRFKFVAAITLLGCAGTHAADSVPQLTSAPSVRIINGKWFDGATFQNRTVYMSRGVFIDKPRTEPDSVIDLRGGYAVAPFAEAHNHNFDASTPKAAQALVAKYQKEGVFYGQNPANTLRARDGLKDSSMFRPGSTSPSRTLY